MEKFNDEFGDLSQFKILSFETVSKGFTGNSSPIDKIINKDDSPEFRSKFHDYRNTPLGHSYLTDDPVSVYPFTGIDQNGQKGYEYRAEVLSCENGSQVLGNYNANKREPQSLFLFYEKPDSGRSNFAGDFYIAKMGDYFVQLFKRFPEPLPSSVGGKFFKNIASLEDEAAYLAQLAYTYEGDRINPTLIHEALMREYQFYTGDRRFEEMIGNIISIPADAIGWCAEQLESLKPTEKNYDPGSEDYAPLVPIVMGAGVIPLPINMNKASQFFENMGNNPFVQGTQAAFTQVWELVKQAAGKVKDASIEHLPDAFKGLVEKISNTVDTIQNFLSEIKAELEAFARTGVEILKIANAFYCGVIGGLVGLLQCILYILQFLFQPTTALSYDQYKERRDVLEKAEDVLDWILTNGPVFLKGIKDLFSSGGGLSLSDFEDLFDTLKGYWDNTSQYTAAYYSGLIAFEFIINILLLIFTEGAGNIIKGTTYVQKAASLLKVITREAMSAVTFGITDLLAVLKNLIMRFGKACMSGLKGFINFIEDVLQGAMNSAKAEDLIQEAVEIEGVIIQGKILRGLIAQDIKRWLQAKYRISRAALELLEELGLTIIRNIDDRLKGIKALATPEGFMIKYGNDNIFEGTGDAVKKFSKKIEDINRSGGKSAARQYINELKDIQNYMKTRKGLKENLNQAALLAKFKNTFIVKHFDAVAYYEKMIRKYPKLRGTTDEMGNVRQVNFAEFTIGKTKNGKFEKVEELYHSGQDEFYKNDFTHPFEEGDQLTSTFKKGISDLKGKSRRNDSEAKFIFNFIRKHLHTADEFIIETKNIYFTCTSCQRELLMLQDYATGLGKKVEIIIHGDENIEGGIDLFKIIKK